jgi:2-haloalkanoic acid dehalogenase type II
MKMQINAVLFDLGGTLVKTAEIPAVIKRILDMHKINRSLKEIKDAKMRAEKELDLRELTKLLDEFWVQWNTKVLKNLHVDANTQQLAKHIATHWWDYAKVSLYPDAERTLPMLKEKELKLGVVTNGLQSDVDQILPKVGLRHVFDSVVVIDTLKKMKPDKEVFLYALQELKVAPSHAIFIGDEMKADYKGAKGAGLTAYLVDRDGKVQDENVSKLSSLDDLFEHEIID